MPKFFAQIPEKFINISFWNIYFSTKCSYELVERSFDSLAESFFRSVRKFLAQSSEKNINSYFGKCSSENQFWEYQFLSGIVLSLLRAGLLVPEGASIFNFRTFVSEPVLTHRWRKFRRAAAPRSLEAPHFSLQIFFLA